MTPHRNSHALSSFQLRLFDGKRRGTMRRRAATSLLASSSSLACRTVILTRGIRSQYHAHDTSRAGNGMDHGNQAHPWASGFVSPRQLAHYLDTYVVGQERAKKILSVAVFNHYNRVRANLQAHEDIAAAAEWSERSPIIELQGTSDATSRSTGHPHPQRRLTQPHFQPRHSPTLFEKSNVLVLGPTGSGKTLLARTLAKVLDVPFAISDATSLTQAGYVGEDVESVIQRLLQAANWDTRRAGFGIVCIDECDKLARRGVSAGGDGGRDVGGEGVQQALLRMLEGTVVNVKGGGLDGNLESGATLGGMGGSEVPPTTAGLGTYSSSSSGGNGGAAGRRKGSSSPPGGLPHGIPPKSDTYQVDTTDILFILSGAFVGLDKIIRNRVAKGSIGFNAPILSKNDDSFLSRLASPTSKKSEGSVGFMPFFTPNSPGKEMDILDLVEPADLVQFGFIPEFTSRLPTTAVLHQLTSSDLLRVLTEVRGALAKQYEALFGYSGIEIRFTTLALKEICEIAVKRGGGARGLRGIMESLLLEPMYDCPGSSVRYVLIDQAVVRGECAAHYWSRSESAAFYGMLAAEEERWETERKEMEGEPEAEVEAVQETVAPRKPAKKRGAGSG